LGRVNLDLAPLIVHDIVVGSGFGSVHLVVPQESLGRVYLRSTLGNIHLTTPLGYNTRIIIEKGWFADIFADEYRYEEVEGSVFESVDFDDTFPLVEIHISSTFGDIYLA